MTDSELREIKDRIEIEELMYRYAEMVDRRDWKRMDQIFALEATIDYSATRGRKGPFRENLAWLDRALESWPINLHIITNLIIELDGDEARSRLTKRCSATPTNLSMCCVVKYRTNNPVTQSLGGSNQYKLISPNRC